MSVPTVHPGQVRLNGPPQLIHSSDGCQIWEIDCDTKYAEGTVGIGDDEVEVLLWKGERTLRDDETADHPTRITLAHVGDSVMFDGGRYAWRLAIFTHNTDPASPADPV